MNCNKTAQHENRFDILFQPIQIGPVTAPNRFFQVPHCNGMGFRLPRALATMRGIKAEGGWGVVCTEEVEIHHSSDLAPNVEGRLWDDRDIPALAMMVESVHQHGALAGIELTYSGHHAPNLYSRSVAFGPHSTGTSHYHPGQTRALDKEDIRTVRRWHRDAALRAKKAGFDIVYCYAGHNLSLAMHFLLPRYNQRRDEYGGSLKNRVRFLKELLEDTKEAVGDQSAVALRLAVDELLGEGGLTCQDEGQEIVSLLAELPDLWDVNISGWTNDSATSRFEKEGFQEPFIKGIKQLTSKPVVGVGRYTTPESMLAAIENNIVDLIGSARPSIADPFLPQKIKENRFEDIRECIGCNICVSADSIGVPIRCTQNPTMGEEWRRDWHPERVAARKSKQEVLVVGAGPAGLECASTLGRRGYAVILVDAAHEPGGRVLKEASLPGLQEWRRVIDWRITLIKKLNNVALHLDSPMTAADILEVSIPNVIIATGATWRRDGVGRQLRFPVPGLDTLPVFTPDDLLSGHLPSGRVAIYDDDHYYMGGLLAELLMENGCAVTLITPAPLISIWTEHTLEQEKIQRKLMALGVDLQVQQQLVSANAGLVTIEHTISGAETKIRSDALVLLTDRNPNNTLTQTLKPALADGRLSTLRTIGDADAPHIIAEAVFSGHLAAREFEEIFTNGTPFKTEVFGDQLH